MKQIFVILTATFILFLFACTDSDKSNNKDTLASETVVTELSDAESSEVYSVPDKNFSVIFPSQNVEVTSENIPFGDSLNIPLSVYVSEKDDAAYFVSISEYPAELIEMSDVEAMLNGGVKGMLQQYETVNILKQEIFKEGKNTGITAEAEVTAEGYDVYLKTQNILAGNVLYQIYVLAENKKQDTTEINNFMSSFKLLNQD